MSISDTITRWRYRAVPDHLLGEILSKRWVDNAIPVTILLISVVEIVTSGLRLLPLPYFPGPAKIINRGA